MGGTSTLPYTFVSVLDLLQAGFRSEYLAKSLELTGLSSETDAVEKQLVSRNSSQND